MKTYKECSVPHEGSGRIVAVKAVIQKAGRILVVQRAKEDTMGGFYEFPGGGVEEGESMIETLKRELFEEVGFEDVSNVNYHSCIDIPSMEIHLIFYTAFSSESPQISLDHTDMRWINEVPYDIPLTPETEKILVTLFAA